MNVASVSGMNPAQIMSGASMRMPPQQKMSNLFSKIDTANAGAINQSQFAQAFQTLNPPRVFKAQGADSIWKQLDPNGTGNVSKQNFVTTMKQLMVSLRADPASTATAGTGTLNSAG